MSKKCTLLWHKAHFEVKILKTPGVRTTFGGSDVEKVHAVVARSTFRSVKNTRGSDRFWRFKCRFASLRFTTLHYTPLHSTTLQLQVHNYTPLHSLHSTTLHYTKLHYTKLHYTTLPFTTLHYITLHYTTFRYTSLHYSTLHSTTLQLHNYTPLHSTTLRGCGAKHMPKSKCTKHTRCGPLLGIEMSKKCTPLWPEARSEVKMLKRPGVRTTSGGSDVLHYITLHYTTLHYTTLHYTTLHNTTTTSTQLHSTTLH